MIFRLPDATLPSWVIGLTLLPAFLPAQDAGEKAPQPFPGLTYHAAPKALSSEAVTADWPRFLGPSDDAKTTETRLLDRFPEGGPAKVWEMEKGESYTTPVIVAGRLVVFNRRDEEEVVQCLEPESGKEFWSFRYPVEYRDRYGFGNGPRASAVISEGRVYTLGVTSVLTCLDLGSGAKLWQRELGEEHELMSYFFGHGACPLVHGGKVIVPLGTTDQASVVAFDAITGEPVWTTRHEWQASYASPIVATLQGKPRLLVFAGDDSDPPVGGLLCIDPESGALHDAFPWRPDKYESVNGSTPVVLAGDRVFLSSSYGKGSVTVHLNEALKWEEVWRADDFGLHWNTALLLGDHLYGFQGRNEPDAWLAALSVETGKEVWRADPEWTIPLPSGRDYKMKYFRGSLLQADGRAYALGEFGTLGILELTPAGMKELDKTQLFLARSTWSLPVIHRGLLYIAQHEPDMEGHPPRLICYDLRR